MRPPWTNVNPLGLSNKPKIMLRKVTDDWRRVAAQASSPSPLGHLSRHLTLQTLALLARLSGTRAGVITILDSLSPHCNLISTNALDLNQACDLVQHQFLGCLAAFVTSCAAAHGSTSSPAEQVTEDGMLRILADARYDYRLDNSTVQSAEETAWDRVVEQGEHIVSEWVRTPATATPGDTVTDEERTRRREMFDELAEQLSDLMTREYPRLWRQLNDHVEEISIQVAVPTMSTSTVAGSRKQSTVGLGHQKRYSIAVPLASPTVSVASAAPSQGPSVAMTLSEKYSAFQHDTSQDTDSTEPNSTLVPAKHHPHHRNSQQSLTTHQRQSALARIRTEYSTPTTAAPTAHRTGSSASSSNPGPFRVHMDRHFPRSAKSRVLAVAQSADSQAYKMYAATHVRRPPHVSHATPWIPPNFSSSTAFSGPTPPPSTASARARTPASASLKYGGSWTIPPHMRARAIRERAFERETDVSMGYRLTPSGGERNAQVRGKVDELARRVAGVSVEMAAEAGALHAGGGGAATSGVSVEGVGGKAKGKRS